MPAYDVFLSHAGADQPAVEALARRLRDEEGLRVFFDRWELVPGAPWQEALEEALANSRSCAVFLGPEGIGPWHSAEMRVALGQRVAAEPKRVIPVLLPGASQDAVPGFLGQRARVDFRGGLDDEAAYARLVAGVRGVAPGGGGPETLGAQSPPEPPGGGGRGPGWWRRQPRLGVLGLAVGILGALLTTVAWLWPPPPAEPPSDPATGEPPAVQAAGPAIYYLRVQVLDPDRHPLRGSTVRTSASNEPHLLPDGWWQVEIAAAKVPLDRQVTIWAEHPAWEPGRADVELGADANPAVEVRLKTPESRLGGVVLDPANRGVAEARVTVMDHVAAVAVTDRDGRFELTVEAAQGQKLRLHVEHSGFPAKDSFCYAGSAKCAVTLGSP